MQQTPLSHSTTNEPNSGKEIVSLGLFGEITRGVKSLLSAMIITLRYLISPKAVVTRHYPDNRATLEMFERFRGRVFMPHNMEANTHSCTGCGICESACPNGTIRIITKKNDETKKKELDLFVYRYETCIICNLCIEACPFDAIAMSNEFETAVYDRRDLVMRLNRPGSKLETGKEDV